MTKQLFFHRKTRENLWFPGSQTQWLLPMSLFTIYLLLYLSYLSLLLHLLLFPLLSLPFAHSSLSPQTTPPAYVEQKMPKLPKNYNFLKGKTSNTSEQSFTLQRQAFEVSRDHLKTWERGASNQPKIALTEPPQGKTHFKCKNVKNISC